MKVLLDTHTFLWLVTNGRQLSPLAKELFLDDHNELYLSAVTGFEIAVKYSLGKLRLTEPPSQFIQHRLIANNLLELPIAMVHTTILEALPLHHRDPFDRLLIAQAMHEKMPLLSADQQLSAYPVERLW
jgi:PIN domain nuclease of toxin-antitoxin system